MIDGGSFQCPDKTTAAPRGGRTDHAFSVFTNLLDATWATTCERPQRRAGQRPPDALRHGVAPDKITTVRALRLDALGPGPQS